MEYYIDIELKPDAEMQESPLMNLVYNKFHKALEPIHHLEETAISKYSLQTSFYEYVLKTENYFPGVNGYKRALIHLKEDDYEIIPLEDYSNEIKELLKYEGF